MEIFAESQLNAKNKRTQALYRSLFMLMTALLILPVVIILGMLVYKGGAVLSIDFLFTEEKILADPERFVEPDPDVPRTLLDQKAAGKRLMLITNSDWNYARRIMEYAFDPYLDDAMSWRDLFDTVVVSAGKPGFFFDDHTLYHVVDEELSLLTPHAGLAEPGAGYFGGCARRVEDSLGLSAYHALDSRHG